MGDVKVQTNDLLEGGIWFKEPYIWDVTYYSENYRWIYNFSYIYIYILLKFGSNININTNNHFLRHQPIIYT